MEKDVEKKEDAKKKGQEEDIMDGNVEKENTGKEKDEGQGGYKGGGKAVGGTREHLTSVCGSF